MMDDENYDIVHCRQSLVSETLCWQALPYHTPSPSQSLLVLPGQIHHPPQRYNQLKMTFYGIMNLVVGVDGRIT